METKSFRIKKKRCYSSKRFRRDNLSLTAQLKSPYTGNNFKKLQIKESKLMSRIGDLKTISSNFKATPYGIMTPQKFNPLCRESPLMKIDPERTLANKSIHSQKLSQMNCKPYRTTQNFYRTRKLSQEPQDHGFQSSPSLSSKLDTANLIGKVKHLESEISEVNQLVSKGKNEIEVLKIEKDTLSHVLDRKISDGTQNLDNYSTFIASELKRHYQKQRLENNRLSEQLVKVNKYRTSLKQKVIELTQRVEELEEIVGPQFDQ
ncbi:unnamed protein product [Moneuplotes crassus]|uniref:Uncharacterized protein n=1 Tax=Euplotes crassus TaxID=5936 RepID=A0AAD1XKG7_EUPCR|nr:unnamed protein product [Moneuplotes crassus]